MTLLGLVFSPIHHNFVQYFFFFCVGPLILLTFLISLRAQGYPSMYREVTLLDFEFSNIDDFTIHTSAKKKPRIFWHSEFPAPIKGSKRYMGLNVPTHGNETLSLKLKKPIILTQYCKEIRIWIYGTFNSARLYFRVKDTHKNIGTIYAGALKFRGWRKLKAKIPKKYLQNDNYLNAKTPFQITHIVYGSGSVQRLKKEQYIFIDDLIGYVRPRYLLMR